VNWVRFDSPVLFTRLKFQNHLISVWLWAPCVSFLSANENRAKLFKHPNSEFSYFVSLRPNGCGARIKGFLFQFGSVAKASMRVVVTRPNDVTNNMLLSCHYLFDVLVARH
jgi:hypothetical protein